MLGMCQGTQFFLWGGGLGGWGQKIDGPLTVGLAV